MMKKLGVRWMPGLPFTDDKRIDHAFSKPEDFLVETPGINLALVLVIAQDPNINVEKSETFLVISLISCHFLINKLLINRNMRHLH
jgi:hypothetical protein